jgi:ribosomal protein RSM22 (predicted rRNA methylase)
MHFDDEEREDDYVYASPWQTLLGQSARAAWRASSPHPPNSLVDVQTSLLEKGQRTNKQLRRTHQRVLNAHTALAGRRERERQRIKQRSSRPDSLKNKKDMALDSSVKPVYYGQEQTLSSLRHRLLPNYAIVKRVLMEAQSLIGSKRWKPERVIDFGIGCGGASAAALDVFDTIDWIHGIDPSRSMLDCADLVLKEIAQGRHVPAHVTLNSSLSTDTTGSQSVGFDMALFAYTATELPHTASTLAAAAALWEKLRPNGLFVMIEPGTPDGFNSVRSVRSMLLDCCPPGDLEAEAGTDECHILAPCTHNKTCPMERHRRIERDAGDRDSEANEYEEVDTDDDDDDEEGFGDGDGVKDDEDDTHKVTMAETDAFRSSFCSFVHTMPGADHRSKGEKLSFLVAQKRIVGDPETDDTRLDQLHNEFRDTNIAELLAQLVNVNKDRNAVDEAINQELREKAKETQIRYINSIDPVGLELIRGDKNRESFGRIIRAPIKKRGHVYVDYCGAPKEGGDDGRIVRHRVTKGWCARIAPGMYTAARKARWGGLWPELMEEAAESDSTCDDSDLASEPELETEDEHRQLS